jgi:hypothetical protein
MNKILTELIRTDCVEPPARPIAPGYRPPMSEAYRLRDGDSWASVARAHDIAAWDLIVFNFPGLSSNLAVAAKEVNWYLQEFVGCRKTTPDRRNYLFHAAAQPGVIYVPTMVKIHEPSVNAPLDNFDTEEDLADVECDHLYYSHQAGNRWR